MWKNAVNGIEAQVTHYTVNVNEHFMSNQTANLSSTAYYSLLFVIECAETHTVDISATNICGTGLRTIYRTQRQGQQCPTNTDTSSCDVTDSEIPPITSILNFSSANHGYSEQNRRNGTLNLIILIFLSFVQSF